MSQPQYGWGMDQPQATGSVKRARERARTGQAPSPYYSSTTGDSSPKASLSAPPRRHMPPSNPPSQPPPHPLPAPPFPVPNSRPRPPMATGERRQPVNSKPAPTNQWPLPPGSPLTPRNGEVGRPPPGRPLQAPPRPPRSAPIPSIVNQTQRGESIPVFLSPDIDTNEGGQLDQGLNPSTPATASSRLTSSSVGTIPEFPTPVPPAASSAPTEPAAPRRGANLGPPPSSRRGASGFFSNASNVSPIPEESNRSHGSFASSAAMPETWSPASPMTPLGDGFYDDSVTDKSRDSLHEDFEDESKLVRSASIGKKGKAALVDNRPSTANSLSRPSPKPVQQPFQTGTGYVDVSTSSSNTLPSNKPTPINAPGVQDKQLLMPAEPEAAVVADGQAPRLSPQPRMPSRLSSIRRPPKLDINAVREAEARGSMTSLPDLIKRATRLAAMIDGGKRPASRFENLNDYFSNTESSDQEKEEIAKYRHQSGLSDMLAAFPSPAQLTPSESKPRGSWFRTTSWPLAPSRLRAMEQDGADGNVQDKSQGEGDKPKRRRCCGLPPWAFVLLIVFILCVVAAAIVLPLQFFVFKTLGNHESSPSASEQCQAELDCQNGGTNVLSQGVCSCICTNGYTGSNCTVAGSEGCTTTDIVSSDSSAVISNVTLGNAIPRLISDSNANFSIPLSGTEILAKIYSGDLSCLEQNSLVTFDGRSTRTGEADSEVSSVADSEATEVIDNAALSAVGTLTVDTSALETANVANENYVVEASISTDAAAQQTAEPSSTASTDSTSTNSAARSVSTSVFVVTEEVLDFARVAVLYVLQEEGASNASTAQSSLENFFGDASETDASYSDATESDARNVTMGGANTINLVDFHVDIGDGIVGAESVKRSLFGR